MTEEEAKHLLATKHGSAACERIATFIAMVLHENTNQNLISRGSIDHIWARHVLDSAQLLELAQPEVKSWLDVGTGAGFPGAIIGLLCDFNVTLVEPRSKRAAFLAAAMSSRRSVTVIASNVEKVPPQQCSVISARAVASVDILFAITAHLSDSSTRYILPRGRSVNDELEFARCQWHGMFHVKPSITDMESGIIVADRVQRR